MKEYFKPRGRFDFNQDTFDIGKPLFWNKGHYDNHFLYRLFKRKESEYDDFYHYHLSYFRQQNPEDDEKIFFDQVWAIVKEHIKRIKRKDNYSSRHPKDLLDKIKLQAFKKYLRSIDHWNKDKTKNQIISEQRIEILELQLALSQKKQDLEQARKLDTKEYINLPTGMVLPFLDLCKKIEDIILPDGKELVFAQFPIVWVKMICKFFREGHEEIKFDRIRRYFPKDRSKPSGRSSDIPADQKLFEIKTIKKRG